MTDNAFERQGDKPLFTEDDLPLFEQMQRHFDTHAVDDSVTTALRELPPDDDQVEGIKRNIEGLKEQGLWATARFYERLLEKREAQEG